LIAIFLEYILAVLFIFLEGKKFDNAFRGFSMLMLGLVAKDGHYMLPVVGSTAKEIRFVRSAIVPWH
jgi:hypothetical protein